MAQAGHWGSAMADPGDMVLLRVEAPNFVAGAVWIFSSYQTWACIAAAPILNWMVGENPEIVKRRLQERHYQWEFIPFRNPNEQGIPSTHCGADQG